MRQRPAIKIEPKSSDPKKAALIDKVFRKSAVPSHEVFQNTNKLDVDTTDAEKLKIISKVFRQHVLLPKGNKVKAEENVDLTSKVEWKVV